MKKLLSIAAIGLLSFSSAYSQNTKKAAFKSPLDNKEISILLEKHMSSYPNNTQLSIAMIDDKNIAYIGVIRKNDVLEKISNEGNSFEIGSITKVFTSVLLASQVSIGKMSLDDPIKNYLPFTLKDYGREGPEITLKMLANHTSGLPRMPSNMTEDFEKYKDENPYRDYDSVRLDEYLKNQMKLDSIPGAQASYSNLGAGLLGYILCLNSKQTFEDLLQQYIFKPLKMYNSSTFVDKHTIVKGQYVDGNETANWDMRVLEGAGAIKSTAKDMAKFAIQNIEGGTYYDLVQEPTFSINEWRKMGLGWNITDIPEENIHVFSHNGGTGGYRSNIVVSRKNKIGVVVLSNLSGFGPLGGSIDELSKELMGILRSK
jgi:CubicO group peptidase (beta-lactamase class C family)